MSSPLHQKHSASPAAARHEQAILRLVQGDGIVPLPPQQQSDPGTVETRPGRGSLADLLEERGRLPEPECRGIGVGVARAVARVHSHGLGHGDVKPANIVFSPTGGLWLADFDAAAALGEPRRRGTPARLDQTEIIDERSDIVAIAVLMIECATGIVIDPRPHWTEGALVELGCPAELAGDVATILGAGTDAGRIARILGRSDNRVPDPATAARGVDPTPTVDFGPSSIGGLGRVEQIPAVRPGSGHRAQMSSRKRSSRRSRLTTRRASPSDTNTTAGRSTLL